MGVSKVSRLRREEDLAEYFPSSVLDLLMGLCALARRGSEFERRNCCVGGSFFVNLLLMPG